jgi:hypothetical protein
MKTYENVIGQSYHLDYCINRAKANEKETGNKTIVTHAGTMRPSSLTDEMNIFLIIEFIVT